MPLWGSYSLLPEKEYFCIQTERESMNGNFHRRKIAVQVPSALRMNSP